MKLDVYSWNVNGLRAILRRGELMDFIKNRKPAYLALQETKLRDHQLESDADVQNFMREIDELGYELSHAEASTKKGWSGVMTLTLKTLGAVHRQGIGVGAMDEEGRIIHTRFEHEELKDLSLYNVYFPNGKSNDERLQYKLWFYDRFLEHLLHERKELRRSQIFVGDVNTAHREIDLARPKENEKKSGFLPVERAWMDKVEAAGYVDTFRFCHPDEVKYSWWSMRTRARERNIGWRIDYIYVSEDLKERLIEAEILTEVRGSDHCPIVAAFNI